MLFFFRNWIMGMKLEASWHQALKGEIEQPYISGFEGVSSERKGEKSLDLPASASCF